ncbi:hypothetical protein ABI59_15265 [Acidobacteria bacterium Mor1]|nr:hypothetical protein ABI59_15265 [Acidobacteria bacterium Mor1]
MRRKWTRRRSGGVPSSVSAYVTVGGRKRRCSIPTDVEELGWGEPEDAIIARPPRGRKQSIGSACCEVELAGDPESIYLLGCHHVFALSSKNPGLQPDEDAYLVRTDDTGQEFDVGPLAEYTNLSPGGNRFAMDAALALIEDEDSLVPWISDLYPSSIYMGNLIPKECEIATPTGVIPAECLSEQFGVALEYRNGQTRRFASVYESEADTYPGDSGSALIDEDGRLLGMHFYGLVRERPGGGQIYVSVAIPAYRLFGRGVFSGDISLVD